MGVLFPNPKDIRFWNELYGRTDEEMSGRVLQPAAQNVEFVGPLESIGNNHVLTCVKTPSNNQSRPSPSPFASIGRDLEVSPTSLPGSSSDADYHTGHSSSTPPLTSMVPDWFSSSRQASQSRPKQPEFLANAGTGVRSMWGKLSSNASTAFSVVQEAYSGVAKDLGRQIGRNDDRSSGTAKLHDQMLSTWDEESTAPSRVPQVTSSFLSLAVGTNPWASERIDFDPSSSWDENPWDNISATSQQVASIDSSDPLSLNPAAMSLCRVTTPPTARAERMPQSPAGLSSQLEGTDPLGVGPI